MVPGNSGVGAGRGHGLVRGTFFNSAQGASGTARLAAHFLSANFGARRIHRCSRRVGHRARNDQRGPVVAVWNVRAGGGRCLWALDEKHSAPALSSEPALGLGCHFSSGCFCAAHAQGLSSSGALGRPVLPPPSGAPVCAASRPGGQRIPALPLFPRQHAPAVWRRAAAVGQPIGPNACNAARLHHLDRPGRAVAMATGLQCVGLYRRCPLYHPGASASDIGVCLRGLRGGAFLHSGSFWRSRVAAPWHAG